MKTLDSAEIHLYGSEQRDSAKPFAVSTLLPSSKPSGPQISISTGTAIRICLVVLAVGLFAYLTYRILPVLLLLLIGIMLATAIEPVVTKLRRGPFSRSQGVLIVYSGIFAVLVLIGYLIIPVFVNQIGDVINNLPNSVHGLEAWAKSIQTPVLRDQALNATTALNSFFPNAGTGAATTTPVTQAQVADAGAAAVGLAEGALSVILLFVIAFYWMTERTLIKRSLVSLLPTDRGNRIRRVWDEIEVKVGGWVRGQLTLMGIVGLISAVGYFAIGVRYWPALALFIAIAEAIPLVGPYIGTIPAILVALTQPGNDGLPALLNLGDMGGVTRAILVAVFAVVLQTVEGNVLVPRIMRNSVGISALTVIASLLIGSALAGLPGALLAVPTAGAIQVILGDLRAAAEAHTADEKRQAELTAAEEEKAAEQESAAQIILPGSAAAEAPPPHLILPGTPDVAAPPATAGGKAGA
ncbi:MAG: AI-2E family transporter [Chloroflexota bacterium]|nr:AI-2E family transporter [Chloroflexota bacterium]